MYDDSAMEGFEDDCGERAEKESDVRGNIAGFGLPARREMRPGVRSSGRSERTVCVLPARRGSRSSSS